MFASMGRRALAASLLAIVLLGTAPLAHADDELPAAPNGGVTLITYLSCVGALAFAETPPGAYAALMFCGKIIADAIDKI
jgi:hypothetical protein